MSTTSEWNAMQQNFMAQLFAFGSKLQDEALKDDVANFVNNLEDAMEEIADELEMIEDVATTADEEHTICVQNLAFICSFTRNLLAKQTAEVDALDAQLVPLIPSAGLTPLPKELQDGIRELVGLIEYRDKTQEGDSVLEQFHEAVQGGTERMLGEDREDIEEGRSLLREVWRTMDMVMENVTQQYGINLAVEDATVPVVDQGGPGESRLPSNSCDNVSPPTSTESTTPAPAPNSTSSPPDLPRLDVASSNVSSSSNISRRRVGRS